MASQLHLCNRMDIARPEFKTQKRRRHTIIVAAVVLGVAAVSVGVSRLKPAAPTVERGIVWTDTVKRGPMLLIVSLAVLCALNVTFTLEQSKWISSTPTFEWPFDPGLSFITMAGLAALLPFFETPLAAALRANGYPPLLLDLEADRYTDHVIAIYPTDGCWGAVVKSNYTGCRWREPVYRSVRELALSHFNMHGERTLRRFSRPINLKRFDRQRRMTTDKPVWFIVHHLFDIKHYSLFTRAQEKRLHRVDERLFQAECLGKASKGNGWRGSVCHNSAVPNIEGTPCPLAT